MSNVNPADKVALNPQPLPPGPDDKVSLNPQPLPPRWMPAWAARLFLRRR
jgi:hypothetical protein